MVFDQGRYQRLRWVLDNICLFICHQQVCLLIFLSLGVLFAYLFAISKNACSYICCQEVLFAYLFVFRKCYLLIYLSLGRVVYSVIVYLLIVSKCYCLCINRQQVLFAYLAISHQQMSFAYVLNFSKYYRAFYFIVRCDMVNL